MITVCVKNMGMMILSLFCLKLLASMGARHKMSVFERLGTNLVDWWTPIAIFWLLFVELTIIQSWAEAIEIYKIAKVGNASGIMVMLMWLWTALISYFASKLVGLKKWRKVGGASIMFIGTVLIVLTVF